MDSCGRLPPYLLVLGLLASCRSSQDSPVGPSLNAGVLTQSMVSGRLIGPDGATLCNQVPPFGTMAVTAISLSGGSSPYQYTTCPSDTYSLVADSGDYRIMVDIPADSIPHGIPPRWLEPGIVSVDGSMDLVKDVLVQEGQALGGVSTLDGAPVPGMSLFLNYGISPAFTAAWGSSAADGSWQGAVAGPLVLQLDEQYVPGLGCSALAAVPVDNTPLPPFIFPTERSSIDCVLQTSPAAQYTNFGSRMAASVFPGDLGGQSGAFLNVLGSGYGVQFPLDGAPQHFPGAAAQLFRGGLIIGSDNRVLTGFDADLDLGCSRTCQDLGLTGTVLVAPDPLGGNIIQWSYDDAGSSEAIGLSVIQQSFDNTGPNDFILLRFAITSLANQPHVIFAGFFGDWDVDGYYLDDTGRSDPTRGLLYVTNQHGQGTHAGTIIRGAPLIGHFFPNLFSGILNEDQQFAALSGKLKNRFSDVLTDPRYIQSAGPILLQPGATAVIWIAVVLGDDRQQLLVNADAADAEIARRSQAQASIIPGTGIRYKFSGSGPYRPMLPQRKIRH